MAIYWQNISRNFNSYIYIAIVFLVLIDFSSAFERENFVFWPNGTVPFYVNPTHFDKEQSLAILSTLSLFAFKTCLQFRPLMVAPRSDQHVLLLENPRGVRHCVVDMEGHANGEPHRITVGYSCLRSPHMEMIIMKALGFPFEHNRAIRDLYIDVQFENIVQGRYSYTTLTDSKVYRVNEGVVIDFLASSNNPMRLLSLTVNMALPDLKVKKYVV